MKRIVIHWTAGTYTASETDKKHYHFIVEGTGRVIDGNLPPEANESTADAYAAHTRNLNTGSIGVAFAAMHGAVERPFDAGRYPITERQIDSLVKLVARLCNEYGIAVTPETVLTHAEVESTLGVKQRAKWDVSWLPDMTQAGHPSAVGDLLRSKVKAAIAPKEKPSLFCAILKLLLKLVKK